MIAEKNDDPPGLVRIDRAAQRFGDYHQITIERARHRITAFMEKRELTMYVAGQLGGYDRLPSWDLRPIFWDTGEIELPGGIIRLHNDGQAEQIYPELYVDETELDRLCAPPLQPMVLVAPPVAPTMRSTTGRPPAHDWDEARRQVLRRCFEHGLPRSKAELAGELVAWFARNPSGRPEMRTIERKISEDFWPMIEDLGRSSELIPAEPERRK